MANIQFNGPAYKLASVAQSCQEMMNMYLEPVENGGETASTLILRPGRDLVTNLNALNGFVPFGLLGAIRGQCLTPNGTYFVIGKYVVCLTLDLTPILVGSTASVLSSSAGPVSMAYNGTFNQILIVDGVAGYTVDTTTFTGGPTVIGSGSFPNGVRFAGYIDGFFVVSGNGTSQFYASGLGDGTTWNGLAFSGTTGKPGPITGMIVDHREIWLFKSNSAEIWINAGLAVFPFALAGSNAFIEAGSNAPYAITQLDNTIFWISRDDRGNNIAWRANGYVPLRVSDFGVEQAWSTYSTTADAIALSYTDRGHTFWQISFPTADATWTYDCATKSWAQRCYRDPLTGQLHRTTEAFHTFMGNTHLLGDWASGKIYRYNANTFTDAGDPIRWYRSTISDTDQAELVTQFFSRLQIDIDSGVGVTDGSQGATPLVQMRYSDNGGHSWSNYRQGSIGAQGQYGKRLLWSRCGSGRRRAWWIEGADPVPIRILGANVRVRPGDA